MADLTLPHDATPAALQLMGSGLDGKHDAPFEVISSMISVAVQAPFVVQQDA